MSLSYLFVCSVPSWGPHAGCRQNSVQSELSSCVLCVPVVGLFMGLVGINRKTRQKKNMYRLIGATALLPMTRAVFSSL